MKTVVKKSSSKSSLSGVKVDFSVPVGVMYLGEYCSSKLDFFKVELKKRLSGVFSFC